MFVVLLPLVAIAAVVAWALGVPGRRVALAAGGAAALLVVATVLVGAFELSEERGAEDVSDERFAARPVRPADVVLTPPEERAAFPAPPPAISGLAPRDVVMVEALVGRQGDVLAAQCELGALRCAPGIIVRPDDEGVVRALVPLERTIRFAGGSVDCAERRCGLVIGGDHVIYSVPLIFGARAATPTLEVSGGRALRHGGEVLVTLRDFPPGPVTVTLCAPPGPIDPGACGAPAPEVVVDVPSTGRARVRYLARVGAVGSSGATCRAGAACAVATPGVAAAPAEITFSRLAHADPPGRRVATGLGVAAVLLLAAGWVLRRTDWTPTEGDPFVGVVLSDPFDDVDLGVPDKAELALDRGGS